MDKGNVSRRGFLQRSLTALTVGAGLPAWYAREVLADQQVNAAQEKKSVAANDRIVMGAIGIGSPQSRGLAIMGEARGHKGVQYVAVCDVDKPHRERAAGIIGKGCAKYHDFRELLDRKDIDAVTIAVPDHWHALVAIDAMKKGKDVYGEKPLALTISEGQAMVKVARQTHRVFQTGSQQRSDARFRLACELVRNNRLGKIQTVETRIGDNPKGGPFPVRPVPDGLDWDFWLGQTPKVDYVKERCHYEFRWWYEYSGGKMTDWGAHHNDIAQWGLGMDGSGPVAVEAQAEQPSRKPNSYNCHPHFTVTYTYATGTKLLCMSDGPNGIKFAGEDDKWIFVDRGHIKASDAKLLKEPLPKEHIKLYVSNDHMGNFLDCLRSRKQPICDVEIGHRSVTVCHIGVISMRTGKKLRWDPAKEHFTGDDTANRWLRREMRAPWKLEV
ncbi:MAG TPA: Gfo/Idh/MocA family oxidoreductase [Gemmataceae bacterium]|jgi:predicted dehydrogenase|nr:Gfo/Idh/MocA family oxidoreductase [Gemmataceae bacterium]